MRRLLPHPGHLPDYIPDDAALAEAYRAPAGAFLRVNFVASLDGVVAVEGRSGGLCSPGDRRVFRTLRALADVVLVGHGTSSAEGYRPVAPDSPVGRLRAVLGRPVGLPVAVVSRRASLDPGDQLLQGPLLLVTCAAADPDRRAALAAAGADVVVCGEDDVDLAAAREALAGRGLEQVVCEGGPQLFRAALAAGVVDELDLSLAPALVGAGSRLLGEAALPELAWFRPAQVLEEDGVLFTRYAVDPADARGS